MWQFALPALQAVGINAGVNLLRRKPLFQNAGTAAVTGGVLGGFNGGGLFSSSPTAGTAGLTDAGAGLSATAPGATAFEASMGLPNSEFIANGGSLSEALGNRISSTMAPIGAGSTLYNQDYFANVLGNPTYTGNDGLLSQIGTGAESLFDTAQANFPDVTPQNLIGVSNLLNNMNRTPTPVASMGGNEIRGTPPKFDKFATGQVFTRKKGNA
jgi:hypothetical protein